jgi:hypothetical protein
MRKILLFILSLLYCGHTFAQTTVTKAAAYNTIQSLFSSYTNANVFAGSTTDVITPTGTVSPTFFHNILTSDASKWVFYVDLEPEKNWGHACA